MTTLCIAVLVIAWLGYLVPWFTTQHREESLETGDATDRLGGLVGGDQVTLVRRAADWDLDDPDLEVSTPFTRRAALREIRQTARLAAVRRRRLMVTLVALTVLTAVLAPVSSSMPTWSAAVPAVMLVASAFICRYSTRTMDAALTRRRDALRAEWENDTILLHVPEHDIDPVEATEFSIDLTGPIEVTGSLWEPIPVIAPSYVTKPLVPRTVRTIDLSAPAAPVVVPPTAEAPASADALDAQSHRLRRAAGE